MKLYKLSIKTLLENTQFGFLKVTDLCIVYVYLNTSALIRKLFKKTACILSKTPKAGLTSEIIHFKIILTGEKKQFSLGVHKEKAQTPAVS